MEEQLTENGGLNGIMLTAAEIFQKGCHRFAKAIKSRENNNNENVRIGGVHNSCGKRVLSFHKWEMLLETLKTPTKTHPTWWATASWGNQKWSIPHESKSSCPGNPQMLETLETLTKTPTWQKHLGETKEYQFYMNLNLPVLAVHTRGGLLLHKKQFIAAAKKAAETQGFFTEKNLVINPKKRRPSS